ncbi:uncharacterized protein LOC144628793 [Oculina patagonica]
MDWTLCAICQEKTSEPLSSPQHSANWRDPLCVYRDFIENLTEFEKLNAVPVKSGIASTDVSERSAEAFLRNKALWHRSCHQKFNNSKLEREQTRKHKLEAAAENGDESKDGEIRRSKRKCFESSRDSSNCIFCDQNSGKLHEYSTFSSDTSIRNMAQEMQDTVMVAKISGGDVVAIGAKYHLQCLTAYRNKYRSYVRQHETRQNILRERSKARVFAELASYLEESLNAGISIFQLSELHSLYEKRLKELGEDISVNKTRLKEKLLDHFSSMGLQEQSDGKNTVLVFPEGMQQMIKDMYSNRNYDDEVLLLAKVAKMCRNEILSVNTSFSGAFSLDCQCSITPITNELVSMILYGLNIERANERTNERTNKRAGEKGGVGSFPLPPPRFAHSHVCSPRANGLKQPIQKVVQRAMTNVDCVINMDNILHAEVSTPAKNSILPNFGDEALDSWCVFADVSKACTVAEFASILQVHVNCMPHKVVADFRGFYYGTADCPSSVFPEGAGQMNLKKRNHFSQI